MSEPKPLHKEDWKNYLQRRKDEYDQRETPNAFFLNGREKGKWDETTSNGLTKVVIEFLKYEGGAFTRVNVMGTPRKNKYGQLIFTPSTTVLGTADIVGCIRGYYMAIEIKIGADRQSEDQIREEGRIKKAGGIYFVAKDFIDFYQNYNGYKKLMDKRDTDLRVTT